jgi:hypothetical protein
MGDNRCRGGPPWRDVLKSAHQAYGPGLGQGLYARPHPGIKQAFRAGMNPAPTKAFDWGDTLAFLATWSIVSAL